MPYFDGKSENAWSCDCCEEVFDSEEGDWHDAPYASHNGLCLCYQCSLLSAKYLLKINPKVLKELAIDALNKELDDYNLCINRRTRELKEYEEGKNKILARIEEAKARLDANV